MNKKNSITTILIVGYLALLAIPVVPPILLSTAETLTALSLSALICITAPVLGVYAMFLRKHATKGQRVASIILLVISILFALLVVGAILYVMALGAGMRN